MATQASVSAMAIVSAAYVRVRYPRVSEDELDRFAEVAFRISQDVAREAFPFLDVEVHIRLEEGTLSNRAKIAAAITALYFGIGSFGDFVSGINEIATISRRVAGEINDRFLEKIDARRDEVITRRRDTGLPGKLQRTFEEVQRGHLSPEEATQRTLRLLRRNGEPVPPEFVEQIERSFVGIRPIRTSTIARLSEGPSVQEAFWPMQPKVTGASHRLPPETPHPEPMRAIEIWKSPGEPRRKRRE